MKTTGSRTTPTERVSVHSGSAIRWAAMAAVLMGFATLPLAASARQSFDDRAVTSTVRTDLRFEKASLLDSVDVRTSQGIVTLSGSVDNLLAKRLAVNLAGSVRGVLGVIDRITVTPVSRPDEDIRKDILTALMDDPATDSYQVAATVKDAVVTLTGAVGSKAESRLAQRVAEGVAGVKDIHNELTINYRQPRTDGEISADIQAVLNWDVWTMGYPIQVMVKGGHVTLSGTVGSVVERSRAKSDAWVDGTLSVDDAGLTVNPRAREQLRRKPSRAAWTDGDIQKAVQASFRTDPRVSPCASGLNVTVENGVAILDGPVENLRTKIAAARDARDVAGVTQVDNELTVRPTLNLPTDADAQKALQAGLHWDPLLPGFQIEVAVIHHVAFLNGSVDSPVQRAEAQDLASRTKGVVEVRNHLKIESKPDFFFYNQPYYDFETFGPPYDYEALGPLPFKSDRQIKKGIEQEFFWSPFVHRNDIHVTVDNGVATLTGTVGTWIGYYEADQDARKGGAREVVDWLKVK